MEQQLAMRVGSVGVWVLSLCIALSVCDALAQSDPVGQQAEADRVINAHQAIDSAQIDVRFVQYFSYPDETEFVTAEYRVLLDRKRQRVRVDRPGYTLVCDGKDMLLVADALPGRHLRTALKDKLSYERLIEVFPGLAQPVPPALVMLLSESPVGQLSAGQADTVTRLTPDDAGRGRSIDFGMPMPMGTGVLAIDAVSYRLMSMLAEADPQQLLGTGLEAVRMHYSVTWSRVNQPVDEAEFELELKQSHEFTTLAAFLSPNGGNAQQNPVAGQQGQGGGVAEGNSLVGMPLPEIELEQLGSNKKVKLSELDEGVVILECFATWSKTSVLDLPALAEFKAWCEEQAHDVKVYAVAVGEQADHMIKWMDALGKTAKKEIDLPLLLDTSTKAAIAMKLPTVPRTMIVVDGRVVDIYGGVKPTYLEDLKEGLPKWLEKVEKTADEE